MNDIDHLGYDRLKGYYRDQLVTIGKGVASPIPMVGCPLAEIIGAAVPQQRADRIAAYIKEPGARI
jgi:hypothetical protein